MRLAGTAAIYFSAILKYLMAEILELAANVSNYIRKKHITPPHVRVANGGDEELTHLLKFEGSIRLPKKKAEEINTQCAWKY
uniref:Histone H2A n=1 Tax=Glossina palpalis gambiensis TaxID=67801 RepID=A0A1B0C640_9MUSC